MRRDYGGRVSTAYPPIADRPVRWGLLGAGAIAPALARAVAETPGGEVVAVAARDLDRAQALADAHAVPRAYGSYAELCADAGLPVPATLRQTDERLDLLDSVRRVLDIFQRGVFDEDLITLAAATASGDQRRRGPQLGTVERHRMQRVARDLLRPGRPPADLHGTLSRAALLRNRWRDLAGPGTRPTAPAGISEALAAHEDLRLEFEWLARRLVHTPAGGNLLDTDFDDLARRLADLRAGAERLSVVPRVGGDVARLRDLGLGELLDELASRRVSADNVVPEFEFVWWTSLLAHFELADSTLAGHDSGLLRSAAAEYAAADRAHIRAGRDRVRDDVNRHVHRILADLPGQVEAVQQVLREGESSAAPGGLLQRAPELVGAVAPCWLMGPLAVASYVPPGTWFDVVVIDDAESVALSETISAIARAGQVVAFGDRTCIGPTAFTLQDGPDPARPLRSTLDAIARVAPQRELRVQYCAQDERLVSFANVQAHGGRLLSFPSPLPQSSVRLDVLSRAHGTGARHIVDTLADQLGKGRTVAVVTLTRQHAVDVRAELETRLRSDAAFARLVAEAAEPVVVVEVDRATGIRRDVVVLSIGHRGATGQLPRELAALNADSGPARLITAVTRARRTFVVVSPFSAEDLDASALRTRGALMLRDLLAHVASGGSARRVTHTPRDGNGATRGLDGRRRRMASTGSVLDRPSAPVAQERELPPLVDELARRLRAENLAVRAGGGGAELALDLVVEDPAAEGESRLAIVTDAAPTVLAGGTRDRERIQPEQLALRGWGVERVYTRDLFRDPAREVARIVARVQSLSAERHQTS